VRRTVELAGLGLIAAAGAATVALATWSIDDPSLNNATDGPVRNLLAWPGAIAADLLMQLFGLAAVVALFRLGSSIDQVARATVAAPAAAIRPRPASSTVRRTRKPRRASDKCSMGDDGRRIVRMRDLDETRGPQTLGSPG
ncbi:MAG TPA: DNA translocase FtsK 4TM domain-containing protein, partial [Beijerinckiaceae bacterium]|nr:DNA translocase FtsK 4TM domain-containing protein [Beijerinckiaceae bacterium]